MMAAVPFRGRKS